MNTQIGNFKVPLFPCPECGTAILLDRLRDGEQPKTLAFDEAGHPVGGWYSSDPDDKSGFAGQGRFQLIRESLRLRGEVRGLRAMAEHISTPSWRRWLR
jgi:hypothetical protein